MTGGKVSGRGKKILNVLGHQLVTELPCTSSCVQYVSCLDVTQVNSVQGKKKELCTREHLILLLCLTLKLHVLGLKSEKSGLFFLIFTCINQSVQCSTNLVLKRNYDSINQTCVMLIGKTGFSIFLIKISTIQKKRTTSWFGSDKPEKKSGLIFTL